MGSPEHKSSPDVVLYAYSPCTGETAGHLGSLPSHSSQLQGSDRLRLRKQGRQHLRDVLRLICLPHPLTPVHAHLTYTHMCKHKTKEMEQRRLRSYLLGDSHILPLLCCVASGRLVRPSEYQHGDEQSLPFQ